MDLKGEEGELRGVIEIKRAATGKVERYDFVGKIGDGEEEHQNVDKKYEHSETR